MSPTQSVSEFARLHLNFTPDRHQSEILNSTHNRLLLCCTRQWGKSTTAAALAVHTALATPGALILFVSPTLRQSSEILSKVEHFLAFLGAPTKGSKFERKLPNLSRITALPSIDANLRGYSAPALIVIDEASRVKDSTYKALTPMLATNNGRLALLSTPFGERGFFWREYTQNAQHWQRFTIPATQCPRISSDYLTTERSTQGEDWFAQEFLCSFIGMQHRAFQSEWLAAARSRGLTDLAMEFRMTGATLCK